MAQAGRVPLSAGAVYFLVVGPFVRTAPPVAVPLCVVLQVVTITRLKYWLGLAACYF